jgi:hypothetical protein
MMKLLILRTDIKTKKKVKLIKSLFNDHASIINWSIDIEDIDNVLRIEATNNLNESDLIGLIKTEGFYCESLAD